MKRIIFSLPEDLLAAIDQEAKYNCTTRSNLVRQALVWYLRPTARTKRQVQDEAAGDDTEIDSLHVDPEELLKILKQQKLRAGIRAMLRDAKRQRAQHNGGNSGSK